MMFLPIIFLIAYLSYMEWTTRKYRKSFDIVIHVNGIRGKSSIVRMLDAVFRANNYVTFSKVTGTQAIIINTQGKEDLIPRKRVSILEQRKIMKQAYKEKAQVLIIECMALKESYQIHSARMINSDITVISNIKTDHLEVMGLSHESICNNLLKSVGNEPLVTADNFVVKTACGQEKAVIKAKNYLRISGEIKENTDVVLEISDFYNLDQTKSINGIKKYSKDMDKSEFVQLNNSHIYWAFEINDYESTISSFARFIRLMEVSVVGIYKKTLWFNDRYDRPFRSKIFMNWLLKLNPSLIILSGDGVNKNRKWLYKNGFEGQVISLEAWLSKEWLEADDSLRYVFGFGNIRGLENV